MSVFDDREIERLRGLCATATEGPWKADAYRGAVMVDRQLPPYEGNQICVGAENNAVFIAAARTAVPVLLDEIERLRQEVKSRPPLDPRAELNEFGADINSSSIKGGGDAIKSLRALWTDEEIQRLLDEVERLTLLSNAWRTVLNEVDYESRRLAICRTCTSNECQIRERCTSATGCRSLYAMATASAEKAGS